jgi:hypothetical protein
MYARCLSGCFACLIDRKREHKKRKTWWLQKD